MEKTLKLNSDAEVMLLYGSLDENLRYAEEQFNVRIIARNHSLTLTGKEEDVQQALEFFKEKLDQIRLGTNVPNTKPYQTPEGSSLIDFSHKGRLIRAKTDNQGVYLKAMEENDIVFAVGPAGTGKTYLAVAVAVEALKTHRVKRIVLTRPAVEAGESLGFLPGDFSAKIDPYLRPLYDALYDMMEFEEVVRLIQKGVIEIAPLAYMRGRTLNDAFVILDEGQNTTFAQMKMFLTRLGGSSKTVITGDVTQVDLPKGKSSGLIECPRFLNNIKGIEFVYLDDRDVVRHPLVREIIKAYEEYDRRSTQDTF